MYTIISNYYGSLSSKATFENAKYWADGWKIAHPEEEFTIWHNGEKVYTA